MKRTIIAIIVLLLFPFQAHSEEPAAIRDPREVHLANVKQLTFGGENAEAYFSDDGTKLIFQSTRPPYQCDQIFIMNVDGGAVKLLSTGKGATTCAFFFPGGKRFLYASTHLNGDGCPPEPDRSRGYVWPLFASYDIFAADLDDDGSVSGLTRLTAAPRYDAEGAIAPDGKSIVFTSLRDGDLDLYLMDTDGSNVRRITDREGFDGGPFFSWDGKYIVYRSYYPPNDEALADYRSLLAEDLMRPRKAEIFIMNADGTGHKQVTDSGHANWSPFMHPDSDRIIFASNRHDEQGRTFSLYMVKRDGTDSMRITYGSRFDSFPMFSKDGKKLVWCSTRNAKGEHEFNIFIADWID